MNESVHIVLPIPNKVLSPNCMIASQAGRYMKVAAARKCRKLAKEAIDNEDIETKPWEFVHVYPTFYHAQKRKRDEGNYQGLLKATYDGITDSGLIEDDDSEHLASERPKFKIDKKNPRVELLIVRER